MGIRRLLEMSPFRGPPGFSAVPPAVRYVSKEGWRYTLPFALVRMKNNRVHDVPYMGQDPLLLFWGVA